MIKRFVAVLCALVVSCFLLLLAVAPCDLPVAAESGGGGSYRGYYTGTSGYDADDVDTSVSSDDLYNYVNDAIGSSSSYDISTWDITKDFFAYGASLVGAIFSSDTTFSSVYDSWSNYMYDAYFSSGDMHEFISWAFYYGSDGQLHFTDDFINSLYQYINPESFNSGVVLIPPNTKESLINRYTSSGFPTAINAITSYLQSPDPVFLPSYNKCFHYISGSSNSVPYCSDTCFFTSNLTLSTLQASYSNIGLVIPFTSYSDYSRYLSSSKPSSSIYSSYHLFLCYNDNGDTYYLTNFSSDSVLFKAYSATVDSSTGVYTNYGDWSNFSLPNSYNKCTSNYFRCYPCFGGNSVPDYTIYSPSTSSYIAEFGSSSLDSSAMNICSFFLFCSEPIQVYTSVDWYDYYNSGNATSGVVYASQGDVYGALTDLDQDWSNTYSLLQDSYREMLSQGKTLEEIRDALVVDTLEELSTANNYLKQILAEVQSISKKLTASNAVGTVNAASNLLSLISDALDDLFNSSDGAFSLLDFVQDGLSDTMNTVFPFSLPHDLLLIYELLAVDPQVPQVKFHFDLDSLGITYDYTYVANDFTKLAYITRFFSSVSFVMLLIHLTNKMMKK